MAVPSRLLCRPSDPWAWATALLGGAGVRVEVGSVHIDMWGMPTPLQAPAGRTERATLSLPGPSGDLRMDRTARLAGEGVVLWTFEIRWRARGLSHPGACRALNLFDPPAQRVAIDAQLVT